MLDYIQRAQLFSNQKDWFEAASKRKAILRQLFLQHRELLLILWSYKSIQL